MQLTDLITPKEEETIKHYIQLYAEVAEPASLPVLFQVWNKQKRTLYKAFGRNLRIKIPVEVPKNTLLFQHELKNLYETYPIWDSQDAYHFLNNLEKMQRTLHNDFIFEYMKFIAEQDWCNEDRYHASRLVMHQNIEKGYISTIGRAALGSIVNGEYHFQAFKATVKDNMRTVRTIQKVLKAMHFPKMELFEKWRNRVSDLNINQDLKANLVFSIHPLDFMTMSDNNCGWSSCMSWITGGSYSSGTIEMMNSNLAIVAYLESETPFNILFEDKKFNIPNKSWRSLFYINKNILLAGKAYPYYNEALTKQCLDLLRTLVKNNLGWEYQYINQPYKDTFSINNNFYLKHNNIKSFDRPKDKTKSKHAIYVYTNAMYNDLIEYKDIYWCCRNWVPKSIKICLSGPATCMCCGKPIEEPSYINSYDDIGGEKICGVCRSERQCFICGKVKYSEMPYTIKTSYYTPKKCCSDKCLDELVWVPAIQEFKEKKHISMNYYFVIGTRKEFLQSQKVKSFIRNHSGYFSRTNIIEDLQAANFQSENALVIRVPQWVFTHYSFSYRQDELGGWNCRQNCRGQVKFFYIGEKLRNVKEDILTHINTIKIWVPAKEILNESSSAISA